MKYFLTVLVCALLFVSANVQAKLLDAAVGVDANVNTNVNAGNLVDTKVKVNANASSSNGLGNDKSDDKDQFLMTVKSHAELKSDQDLKNFAKGVMDSDENIESVDSSADHVEVTYKLPAKFLGIFSTQLSTTANVSFEATGQGKSPKEVTVKFPWYRIFFSLSNNEQKDVIQTAIEDSIVGNTTLSTTTEFSEKGKTIQLISNLLKAIRVEVNANAEANNL